MQSCNNPKVEVALPQARSWFGWGGGGGGVRAQMESLGIKGQKWRDETRREKNRSREGGGGGREPYTVKNLRKDSIFFN